MVLHMLSVHGDADAAVEAWIALTSSGSCHLDDRDVSLIMTGRLYSSFVRSSMFHEIHTRPVRKENEVAIQWLQMTVVRWMQGMKLKGRFPTTRYRDCPLVRLCITAPHVRWYMWWGDNNITNTWLAATWMNCNNDTAPTSCVPVHHCKKTCFWSC